MGAACRKYAIWFAELESSLNMGQFVAVHKNVTLFPGVFLETTAFIDTIPDSLLNIGSLLERIRQATYLNF